MIEPLHTPTLHKEFYHNGKAPQQASRIHTVCDFGYVALGIRKLVASDGGEYVCHAFNALGESRAAVSLQVAAKGSLDLSS
jgi:titin